MNATQQFMDDTDWVERYAWFGAMEDMQGVNAVRDFHPQVDPSGDTDCHAWQANALMSSRGRINALGEQYIGAATPNVSSDYQPGVVHGGQGTNTSASGVDSANNARPSLAAGYAYTIASFLAACVLA